MADENSTIAALRRFKGTLDYLSADLDGQHRAAEYLYDRILESVPPGEVANLAHLLGCLASNIREVKAKVDQQVSDLFDEIQEASVNE